MQKIKRNLKTLDYLEGTGVISTHKRKLANGMFLFISAGGVGHKTLAALRKQLEWKVDAQELAQKVRYLAVDCAFKELDALTDKDADGRFSREDVLKLPYEGAHDSIHPDRIEAHMKEWVHPDLYQETGAEAIANPALSGFDDTGAGAWRQCGRVRLHQQNAITALGQAVQTKVRELMQANPGTTLNVFILAGIAGGTGSGTVVDLTYLTRHFVKQYNLPCYTRTKVSGYLLLPSACGDDLKISPVERNKGNRNAYAALKEIDYFMDLQKREGDVYRHNYGSVDVEITENIFDMCTLVEGVGQGGIVVERQDEKARAVVSNSILNLICTTEQKAGTAAPFLIDSFTSNRDMEIRQALLSANHHNMPRNAGYHFNVIGYSSYVIPTDLMTLYVANKVFERVWALFEKHNKANEEAAEKFLNDAMLDPGSVKNADGLAALQKRFKAQEDIEFRKYGPYYMINLMLAVENVISAPGKFANYAAQKANGLFANKDAWKAAEKRYMSIKAWANRDNNSLYSVYTAVIRELQALLRKNGSLLTDTQERKSAFGSTFNWSPIDLTQGERATEVIKKYLDNLLPEKEIRAKTDKFVQMMCDKKDEWTQLDPPENSTLAKFDAAKIVRDFIEAEFKELIDFTMEGYLVKLFSGDDKAVVPTLPEDQDPDGHDPLKKAAQNIVTELGNQASSLVQTHGRFNLDNCRSMKYLSLPDGCKWLNGHIENYAKTNGHANETYISSARDSVTFYRLHIGVPACAIGWVQQAESSYDQDATATGLHMSNAKNESDWINLPNLTHEGFTTQTQRETGLCSNAAADLERAKKLGLVYQTNTDAAGDTPEYGVYTLTTGETGQQLLNSIQLQSLKVYTTQEILQLLEQSGKLKKNNLKQSLQVMKFSNATAAISDAETVEFGDKLAKSALRRDMDLWHELQKTFAAIEEMVALLNERNAVYQRKDVLLDCLRRGFITYNARRDVWVFNLGDEKYLNEAFSTNLQKQCKEYYLSLAFYGMSDADYAEIKACYDEKMVDLKNATDEELDQHEAEKKVALQVILDRVKVLQETRRADRDQEIFFPLPSVELVEQVGEEEAKSIRNFYSDLSSSL